MNWDTIGKLAALTGIALVVIAALVCICAFVAIVRNDIRSRRGS